MGDTHYLYLLGEAMPDGASSWLDGSKNKTRSLRKTWLRLDEIENTLEITKQYRNPTRPTRASRAYRASRGSDSCHKSWTLSKSSHTADFQSACNSCTEIQREHQQLLEQYMSCMHHWEPIIFLMLVSKYWVYDLAMQLHLQHCTHHTWAWPLSLIPHLVTYSPQTDFGLLSHSQQSVTILCS